LGVVKKTEYHPRDNIPRDKVPSYHKMGISVRIKTFLRDNQKSFLAAITI
jgi:hypothetical protein